MDGLFGEYSIWTHLTACLLGLPRLYMIAQTAPFFAPSVIGGQIRIALVLSLYFVLHPALLEQVMHIMPASGRFPSIAILAALAVKEVFIGLLLALLAGMVFWMYQSAGFFIDNQRGAGQATESDPLSGEQTSPTGSFFFQSVVYVFFATSAFTVFLATVYSSYEAWTVDAFLPAAFFKDSRIALFFAGKVAELALDMVLLSGPVVIACLLTDVSLGLINRFAPQLNVYVLAMPIKSAIASFLLLFYFGIMINGTGNIFDSFGMDLHFMRSIVQ